MLRYAAQTGVPIYTIRRSNLQSVLPKLVLPASTLESIKNAVNASKVVVTPARQMTKDGWKGVGYIVHGEVTGAAAYRISGGKSGGLMFAAGGIASYRVANGPTEPPTSNPFANPGGGPGLLTRLFTVTFFLVGLYLLYQTWKEINDSNIKDYKSTLETFRSLVLTTLAASIFLGWLLGSLFVASIIFLSGSIFTRIVISQGLKGQQRGEKRKKQYEKILNVN